MSNPSPVETVRHALESKGCQHQRKTGQRTVAANGTSMVAVYCLSCDAKVSDWIGHDRLRSKGINPDEVPLRHDYSGEDPCARCGSSDGTELHHFAPSHLFPDSHRWPTAYLCRPCHDEWHHKTRTGSYYHAEAK